MIAAVADTHTAVWYLFDNPMLSPNARETIETAFCDGNRIGVSSISLVEMIYLVEKGRIPANAVRDLIRNLFDPAYPLSELPVDASIAKQMQLVSRGSAPDMPDRIVAATALRYGVPVISRDRKIRASGVQTVW